MILAQRLRRFFQLIDRRIPDRVPRLSGAVSEFFRVLWLAALLVALVGPVAGLWLRAHAPMHNSDLMLGSRAGFVSAPRDVALVRFTVGPPEGLRRGDRIVAIYGTRLPEPMPVTQFALTEQVKDNAYIAMGNLLFGTDRSSFPLRVRDPDGVARDVTVTTGEDHIDAATREHHISPKLLSFIDVIQVVFYPILLWAAFVLYVRNPGQPVPLLLSLAILLSIGAEQPSSLFLRQIGISRTLNVAMYDVGNISLLAAILLFPDARLRPRAILIPLSMLPALFFLNGPIYQTAFLCAFILGMVVFVRRLRTEAGPTRQQIKLLFVGLAGYPVFRTISVLFDYAKWNTASFSQQLLFETVAAVTFALAVVSLSLVLFSALRRHRLYDADALFSRSAMIALVTLTIGAFFAAASAALQALADSFVGPGAGPWPTVVAAGAAVLLINPLQTRIYRGTKRVFQKDLFNFRTQLPKRMDDLRETASVATLLEVALSAIVRGLRATRAAGIVNGRVVASIGQHAGEVRKWVRSTNLPCSARLNSDREDQLFPLRLSLRSASDPSLVIGWIVLGPRPDASLYSPDERRALLEVEESISRAVEVARERQHAQSKERRWRERLEKRMQALEERLTAAVAPGAQLKIVSG